MAENHPHYVWAFVAILGLGMVAWIYSSNRPSVDNYGKDATHNEQTRSDWPLSIHIGEGSCARFGADRLIGTLKGDKNAVITNRTVNSIKP